ncbi:unnamed protein product, partial [Bubo scandiacus]
QKQHPLSCLLRYWSQAPSLQAPQQMGQHIPQTCPLWVYLILPLSQGPQRCPSLAPSSGLTQALQRRAKAQPKDDIKIQNWNSASPRNLSLSMMLSGQHQNHFSLLFTDSGKIAKSLGCMENHGSTHFAYEDYQKSTSRYRHGWGFPSGYFCREEMVFAVEHRLQKHVVVVLCKRNVFIMGLFATVIAVAWYTPLYWNRSQGWVAKEENKKFKNIVIPTFSTTKQKEGWETEEEFTITDTEWKKADPREKKTSTFLFLNQSAWCQSPNSPTHPHFSLVRPLTTGNDGSSLCRQSRCQSSRPGPVPGTLYAGTSQKKNPSVPSCDSGEGRRRPTQPAGVSGVATIVFKINKQTKPKNRTLRSVLRLNSSSSGDANGWDLIAKALSPVCQQCGLYDPVVVTSRLQPSCLPVGLGPKHFILQEYKVQVPNNRSTDMTPFWNNCTRNTWWIEKPDCSYEFQAVIEPLIRSVEQR